MGKKTRPVVRRKVAPPAPKVFYPRTERDVLFCQIWLEHFDHIRAYKEAGFLDVTNTRVKAWQKLERYREYLRPMAETKQRQIAKTIAVDQQDLIQEYARISSCNPLDFIEPVITMDNGKTVERVRVIPIEKLPRELAAMCEVSFGTDGAITYRIPTIRERLDAKGALGRHLGMFDAKLILEHRRTQQQKKADLRGVDDSQLAAAEKELLKALGPVGARLLGIQLEEQEEEEGTEGA